MNEDPHVLITRLSAIGDCVMTLPLANAIRDHFPKAHISWLIQGAGYKLLEGHPSIDEFIVVKRGWLKSPRAVLGIRKQLRARRFDWTIDPQSLTKSSAAGWFSGARQRIGFTRPDAREIAPWLNNVRVQRTAAHAVDSYLELLEPLGIKSPHVRFDLPVDNDARQAVTDFRSDHNVGRFAVINPGASWASKMWPADRFAEVALHLAESRKLHSVVVWSGEEEKQLAQQIATSGGGQAIIAPATSLKELNEFLRAACLMVSADTGPLHMAAALGTPCVSMYGPTKPSHCGPYGDHQVLQAYYQDGTSRERRSASNDAMRAVGVNEVCSACERALDRPRTQAA